MATLSLKQNTPLGSAVVTVCLEDHAEAAKPVVLPPSSAAPDLLLLQAVTSPKHGPGSAEEDVTTTAASLKDFLTAIRATMAKCDTTLSKSREAKDAIDETSKKLDDSLTQARHRIDEATRRVFRCSPGLDNLVGGVTLRSSSSDSSSTPSSDSDSGSDSSSESSSGDDDEGDRYDGEESKVLGASTGAARQAFCAKLGQIPFMKRPDDAYFFHGRGFQLGRGGMSDSVDAAEAPEAPEVPEAPRCTWRSNRAPRDDHDCGSWLTASEFEDQPATLRAKCRQLATLISMSKHTVLYTGAGISASVIGQAARSGQMVRGWKKVQGGKLAAKPTFTHMALAHLVKLGIVDSWINQNHDGLPEKAGCPQEKINEIHGSWFDASNPVVKYSGSLHSKLERRMCHDARKADLVIVLGTSLGGLYADEVATKTARRSLGDTRCSGQSLGTAMINLQQTDQDGKMTTRIFGRSDDVLRVLLEELKAFDHRVVKVPEKPPRWTAADVPQLAPVPYDQDGRRVSAAKLAAGTAKLMWLDLRDRQRIRITPGHNIQGARQPMYMHIGAKKPRKRKGVTVQPGKGFGFVSRREEYAWRLKIDGVDMQLGCWFLEAAMRGALDYVPVVNAAPTFCDDKGGENEEKKRAFEESNKRQSQSTMCKAAAAKTAKKATVGARAGAAKSKRNTARGAAGTTPRS